MSDDDAFLAALAGRAPVADDTAEPHPGAAALREALQARRDVLREAERVRIASPPLASDDAARLDSVTQDFRRRGLFGTERRPARSSGTSLTGLLQELRRFVAAGASWQQGLAVAACLVLVVTATVQLLPRPDDASDVLRGGAPAAIAAADPALRARQLAEELRKLGADVVLVMIDATEWNLAVDVPPAADRAAIVKLLADAGATVPEYGSYKIVVRGPRPESK